MHKANNDANNIANIIVDKAHKANVMQLFSFLVWSPMVLCHSRGEISANKVSKVKVTNLFNFISFFACAASE